MPSPPTIVHGFSQASYSWPKDTVRMPPRASFNSEQSYYATLFHELVHSTGHGTRLGKKRH